VTGVSDASGDSRLPVIIRYASKITLRTQIQTNSRSKIFPPVLTIEYVERMTVRRLPLVLRQHRLRRWESSTPL
jgi:hypothetical protein